MKKKIIGIAVASALLIGVVVPFARAGAEKNTKVTIAEEVKEEIQMLNDLFTVIEKEYVLANGDIVRGSMNNGNVSVIEQTGYTYDELEDALKRSFEEDKNKFSKLKNVEEITQELQEEMDKLEAEMLFTVNQLYNSDAAKIFKNSSDKTEEEKSKLLDKSYDFYKNELVEFINFVSGDEEDKEARMKELNDAVDIGNFIKDRIYKLLNVVPYYTNF